MIFKTEAQRSKQASNKTNNNKKLRTNAVEKREKATRFKNWIHGYYFIILIRAYNSFTPSATHSMYNWILTREKKKIQRTQTHQNPLTHKFIYGRCKILHDYNTFGLKKEKKKEVSVLLSVVSLAYIHTYIFLYPRT